MIGEGDPPRRRACSPGTSQGDTRVSERKPFLLRSDAQILEAVQRWANDDLRSLNAQIEYLLRKALRDAKRQKPTGEQPPGRRNPEET
jgi:hypothetical protein